MDQLLQLYRDYGLPFPPEDAPLVKFSMGESYERRDGQLVPTFPVGFLLKSDAHGARPEILFGPLALTGEKLPVDARPERIDPETATVDRISVEWRLADFPINTGLATAIQCYARGWTDFAQRLAEASLAARGFGGGPSMVSSGGPWHETKQGRVGFEGGPETAPRDMVAGLAWNYFLNEIVRSESNWDELAPKMKHWIESERELADPSKRAVLASLEASLRPRVAKAGRVETLIDNLVDLRAHRNQMNPDDETSTTALEELGFEAVPALIEHLDDERMTRTVLSGFNNFRTSLQRVGDLVAGLLQTMAGQDLGKDWLAARMGQRVTKADAAAWWKNAQEMGEEKYALAHLISGKGQERSVNGAWLKVIQRKYPQKLPELYERSLGKEEQDFGLAGAVGASTLDAATKLKLLEHGLAGTHLAHRVAAVAALQEINTTRADRALIELLEKLPAKSKEALWTSPESKVAHLVIDSSSPEVWSALLKTARRASIGLRMELMEPMSYTIYKERHRKGRLAFLAAFLDDEEVRQLKDDPKRYDGPCAGFMFARLSIRDFAAMNIASILELPDNPEESWRAQQWAALRVKVRAALKGQQ